MLRLAFIEQPVRAISDALDTQVGEWGGRFLGGERQRLAIARMLLRHPMPIILDEATSGIDIVTERTLLANLRELPGRPTLCIKSHRAETLRDCDRIFTFSNGRIVNDSLQAERPGANPSR